MTTEIIHVAHSFRADRELCELGEDWPLIQQTDEALKNVIAKLELIEARANSEESKRKAYELRQAIGDGMQDASWRAHVVACDLAYGECDVRPMVKRQSANLTQCLDTVQMKRGAA